MWKQENDDAAPPHLANMLTDYKDAVEEFSSSAKEFLSHISILTNARDAYQRAMAVSTQLRQILDTGDETLRILMGQLEQAINIRHDQASSDKKKTEPVKVEAITANGSKADAARA